MTEHQDEFAPLREKYDEAMRRSSAWGQAHLLRFYEELDGERRETLLNEILGLDFETIYGLYQNAADSPCNAPDAGISPAAVTDKRALSPAALNEAYELGLAAMRAGKYAVITMAGGQGTRLGLSGPKGTAGIRLHRDMTLFEVQLERITEMGSIAGKPIPWYIMTSDENHDETVAFFSAHGNFGHTDVCFFRQGSLPMVGLDGKLLLEEKHRVKRGPDGNGSIFAALVRTGVAADMARRGIEWFYAGNVDNILARCADPLPVGLAALRRVPCASKSILKRGAGEKVGVFCRKGGRPAVIEYTELPDDMAGLTDASGTFIYGDAHISCTVFHTSVLAMPGALRLPYHSAVKKASGIDELGRRAEPESANAYKFESFIFDVFPLFEDMVVLRVDREDEFAPIKNKSGEDSLESARELYLKSFEKVTR